MLDRDGHGVHFNRVFHRAKTNSVRRADPPEGGPARSQAPSAWLGRLGKTAGVPHSRRRETAIRWTHARWSEGSSTAERYRECSLGQPAGWTQRRPGGDDEHSGRRAVRLKSRCTPAFSCLSNFGDASRIAPHVFRIAKGEGMGGQNKVSCATAAMLLLVAGLAWNASGDDKKDRSGPPYFNFERRHLLIEGSYAIIPTRPLEIGNVRQLLLASDEAVRLSRQVVADDAGSMIGPWRRRRADAVQCRAFMPSLWPRERSGKL